MAFGIVRHVNTAQAVGRKKKKKLKSIICYSQEHNIPHSAGIEKKLHIFQFKYKYTFERTNGYYSSGVGGKWKDCKLLMQKYNTAKANNRRFSHLLNNNKKKLP